MSATLVRRSFSVVVADSDHWSVEELAAADQDSTCDDWATAGLVAAMYAAGEAYIAAHPTLFRGELI